MAKILLVEDDLELAGAVELCLLAYRHDIQHVVDGEEAWAFIETCFFDLLILDWELPKVSGVELCRRVKNSGRRTPVLMLTGKSTIDDKAEGFDAGADDYLTKPFHKRELAARVHALARRQDASLDESVVFGDLTLDLATHQVSKGGKSIELATKERQLLEILFARAGTVVTVTTMLNAGWPAGRESESGIPSHLAKLQAKLKSAGSSVETEVIAGVGFMLKLP